MSKIVNFNRARKHRARAEAKRQADENAVAFGRPKAEIERLRAQADRLRAALEAHRREP